QKIKIEKLTLNDIREVAELDKNSLLESWSEEDYKESLENPNYNILVAKFSGKIVGFISMYHALDEGYICNIAVDKSHRMCGIGTYLINETITYSKNQNLKFLTLEVRESNTGAIKFYEKLGFTNVGIRKNFYSNPTENAVIMTLYL
ncbi:MAG: ribosomal protein S18-alanine N-acetyltransferase, partial [Clostridia bacterium]|nr:ribosomal protein S18-alanine N-acetyltransferase [Clostridia bacterium]